MTPDRYIDTLLKKYQKAPSFPFHDWIENDISFYALINIWDEIFKNAAGKYADDYVALGDVEQDINSSIYQIKHKEKNIVFGVSPTSPSCDSDVGGIFNLLHTFYSPELQPMDDKFELGIVCDLNRERLICLVHIIYHFTHNLPENYDELQQMNQMLIKKYGHHFGFPDYNPFKSPLFPIQEEDFDDDEANE